MDTSDYEKQVRNIHSKLKFEFGSMQDEFPEQVMTVKYLKGNEKVLEIGGNLGRNSMIIAYILNQQGNHNFVTLECDKIEAAKLAHNRDLNNFKFNIEISALSQRKLIQRNMNTIPSDHDIPGWTRINTITWEDLKNKYQIDFDTLVIDCEGAFFYILYDTPEILDNIKLVIMENDYFELVDNKIYVQNVLKEKGFILDYEKDLLYEGYHKDFYQVWLRP
jgi:hypothetical protein